jgi:hypothetical protein
MKKRMVWTAVIALALGFTALSADASLRYFDTDKLNEGASHTITLRFAKNANYMVVSAASQGSVDFDLTVFGPDGDKIQSSDSTDENTDWVRFTAPEDGDYKVKINAYKGSGWYELIVLNTDGY